MKTLLLIALTAILGLQSSGRNPQATTPDTGTAAALSARVDAGLAPRDTELRSTFATIDITIDPLGQPLGAFQFELAATDTPFIVVGVEAGDHPAFDHARPPYFDRFAMQQDTERLIVAEYALPTLAADALPTRAQRVATVHVMFAEPIENDALPEIELSLIAASNAEGEPINANMSYTLKTPERSE